MEGEVSVTVIATGFEARPAVQQARREEKLTQKVAAASSGRMGMHPAVGRQQEVAECSIGEETIVGKPGNVKDFIERTMDKPAYLRKAAGMDFRNEALGIDDDELDVPTFLRRQAD